MSFHVEQIPYQAILNYFLMNQIDPNFRIGHQTMLEVSESLTRGQPKNMIPFRSFSTYTIYDAQLEIRPKLRDDTESRNKMLTLQKTHVRNTKADYHGNLPLASFFMTYYSLKSLRIYSFDQEVIRAI